MSNFEYFVTPTFYFQCWHFLAINFLGALRFCDAVKANDLLFCKNRSHKVLSVYLNLYTYAELKKKKYYASINHMILCWTQYIRCSSSGDRTVAETRWNSTDVEECRLVACIQAKASSSLLSSHCYLLHKHDFLLSDLILPISGSLSQLILFCFK